MDGNIATFSEFARLLGVKPSAITDLKNRNRLVLTEGGKRVLVAESQQRIRETADPSKAGVVARHAAARAASQSQGEGMAPRDAHSAPGEAPGSGDTEGDEDAATRGDIDGYQASRARREHYLALSAQRDYEREIGKLMDAAEVVAAIGVTVATLRTSLERLPDVLGPQLAAETDEGRARALLTEGIEHALDEASRQFNHLVKQEVA